MGTYSSYFNHQPVTSCDGSVCLLAAENTDPDHYPECGVVQVTLVDDRPIYIGDLKAPDGVPSDHFAAVVAISTDNSVIAVAAPRASVKRVGQSGAVYLFVWNPRKKAYVFTQKLHPDLDHQNAIFGIKLLMTQPHHLEVYTSLNAVCHYTRFDHQWERVTPPLI